MLNRNVWRVLLPVVLAIMAGIGWLIMDRPHRDIAGENARFKLVPEELVAILSKEDSIAGHYLNAVVELYAVVASDDGERVTLKGGVVASWDSSLSHRQLEEGELLRLKGRVTGYDGLFEEVRMDGLVLVAPEAE